MSKYQIPVESDASESDSIKFGGWIPPEQMTDQQLVDREEWLMSVPKFETRGYFSGPTPNKVMLTDLWTHKKAIEALGFPFGGFWQKTGSCVGAGSGNVQFTLSVIEVLVKSDPERIFLPFWPYAYGIGRNIAGMNRPGEGSFGRARLKRFSKGSWNGITPGYPSTSKSRGCYQSPPKRSIDGVTETASREAFGISLEKTRSGQQQCVRITTTFARRSGAETPAPVLQCGEEWTDLPLLVESCSTEEAVDGPTKCRFLDGGTIQSMAKSSSS
ncbi:MAG: hypothetical protein HC888_00785 [Candidatus Competibacteraceae bacterium]|nr:hypothetical protein [Candidatus Competibacteraceae bacterium]